MHHSLLQDTVYSSQPCRMIAAFTAGRSTHEGSAEGLLGHRTCPGGSAGGRLGCAAGAAPAEPEPLLRLLVAAEDVAEGGPGSRLTVCSDGCTFCCGAQQADWLLLLQGACPLLHTLRHRAGTCCIVTDGAAAQPECMPAQQVVRLGLLSAASGHGRQRTKPSLELSSFTVLLLFHPGLGGSAVSRRGLTSEVELPAMCHHICWLQEQDTTKGDLI